MGSLLFFLAQKVLHVVQDRKRFLRTLCFTFASLALPAILIVALPELCARAFGTGIPASIIFEKVR